jgi:hypothetical protein
MEIVDGRRRLMKRIAVVISVVIGIAATPAVVAADSSRQPHSDRYEIGLQGLSACRRRHRNLSGPVSHSLQAMTVEDSRRVSRRCPAS